MRLRSGYRIPYKIIYEEVEGDHPWSPAILTSSWPNFLACLPNNLISLVDPGASLFDGQFNTQVRGYNFGIVQTKDISEANFLKSKVGIVIYTASDHSHLEKCTAIFEDTFILVQDVPEAKKLQKCMKQNRVFFEPFALANRLRAETDYLSSVLDPDGVLKEILSGYKLQKPKLSPSEFDKFSFSDFGACWPNQAFQFALNRMHEEHPRIPKTTKTKGINRSKELRLTTEAVRKLHDRHANSFPTVEVVTYPYENRIYKRTEFKDLVRKLPEIQKKEARKFLENLRIEQNSTTYNIDVMVSDMAEFQAMQGEEFLRQRALTSRALDNLGFLHASFTSAPVTRFPFKSDTLTPFLAPFHPKTFSRISDQRKINEHVHRLGTALYKSLDRENQQTLHTTSPVLVISDLPLEWTEVDGIPLAFLRDVCRLPEHPERNLLSVAAQNSQIEFQVKGDILENTLFLCLDPDDLNIARCFDGICKVIPKAVKTAKCRTVDELAKAVETNNPDLLILFTHGSHSSGKSSSTLKVGKERLDGDLIVKHKISSPLVLVFACEVSPLFGEYNPLPHAFFEAGSLSVLSPMLPIDVLQASILCGRIIGNLENAAVEPIHPNWLHFISHNLRTSFFENALVGVLSAAAWSDHKEKLQENRLDSFVRSMDPDERRALYSNWATKLTADLPPEIGNEIERRLRAENHLKDYLYFTHWGRPDLVSFKSTIDHRFKNSPKR